MGRILLAQSLGQYGGASGGGIADAVTSSVQNAAVWVQLSLRGDRSLWIGGVVCLLLGMWVFRRR